MKNSILAKSGAFTLRLIIIYSVSHRCERNQEAGLGVFGMERWDCGLRR